MAELIYEYVELIMYSYKCVLLGDPGVGKSCLKERVCLEKFEPWNRTNIKRIFYLKEFKVKRKRITLQIWADMHEQRFICYEEASLKPTVGAILVYDITKRESFVNLERFLEETRGKHGQEFPVILVGNKVDLKNERVISYEEGEKFAKENGLMFFETSNSTEENVKEAFLKIAEIINQKIEAEDQKKLGDQKMTMNWWQASLLIVFMLYLLATISKFLQPWIGERG